MGALANHSFVKMNGVGNEIVVVDLRDSAATVTAAEARAVAAPAGVPYDQLMVLHKPRSQGTSAFIRIYNNDGSEAGACGNGMRCVAKRMFAETGIEVTDLTIQHVLADDSHASVFVEVTFTLGDRSRTSQYVDVYRLRGGKATEHWHLPVDPEAEKKFFAG